MPGVGRSFSLSALVSIVDQGLVSGVNLAIGLFFITFGEKPDYGIYAQLFALVMLSQAIQNALVNAPWVTLAPKYRQRRARALSAHLFRLQTLVSAVAAAIGFVGIIIVARSLALPTLTPTVAVAFAALLPGLWLREFARDFFFLRLQPERALVVYTIFSSFTLVLLTTAAIYHQITTATVLCMLTVSCWCAGVWGLRGAHLSPIGNHGRTRPALTAAWMHSRWTLPGVIVSWAFANAHLFVAASLIGVVASANLAAAKLLIMPAGICVLGWANIFLPAVSRWIGEGDFKRIHQVLRRSLFGLWAIIVLYMIILWASYGLLLNFLLGDKYARLLPLVAIWAVYFMINGAVMGYNWILAAAGEYRLLFIYDCTVFSVTIPVMIGGTYLFGVRGTLSSLLLAQAVQLLLASCHGTPKVKLRWARTTEPSAGTI